MRYYINIKIRDINNILKIEKLFAYWYTDIDLDFVVAFNIGIAIVYKNGINPIWFLERGLIKTAEVVTDINRGATI